MPRDLHSDGGTAFPAHELGTAGMSLRDYFAGQALVGVLLSGSGATVQAAADRTGLSATAVTAAMAYQIADAMLSVRQST